MTYIQKYKNCDYLVFPLVDSRLNQIQGVHLKFIEILLGRGVRSLGEMNIKFISKYFNFIFYFY